MVEAVKDTGLLDPAKCREHVRRHLNMDILLINKKKGTEMVNTSIILSVYNGSATLSEAIETVLS
jgi:hypothetical protein